ncbi:universal stress protein [Sedimentibacter sp.]|uniref:universal stress protein n=1 Tax=Sedimentibacter sp. TaxID=1960295 RepID=UPI0028A66852|nr:universal stress protein [Sedimentibacter sp.]
MKKILIPVDGSIASEKAAIKAVEIGKLINAELTFVTVVSLPTEDKYSYFGMNVEHAFITNCEEMLKNLIREETKMLDILVRNLDSGDLMTEKRVVVGKAADEILKIATDEKFDLIVMGRRGLSNVERIFIGSITQKVISQAPCPVMVVNG